ncbi:MAG: 16S rRNA (guanine(966)-N(2))-methyltransferase RsmD [Candidatus Binatia bacterium]
MIGGKVRRRRIKVPKVRALRPTADRVKEALFNILPHDLSGLKVLDLFAGTGNLSIEALSRGAAEAVLVDASREAARAIRENLQTLGLSGKSQVWITPVLRSLRLLSRKGERFDLVFLDPPYEKDWVGQTLRAIAQQGLLRESGILVVEHGVREKIEVNYGSLALKDQRRYGTTLLSFFVYKQSQASKHGELKEYGTNQNSDLSRLL